MNQTSPWCALKGGRLHVTPHTPERLRVSSPSGRHGVGSNLRWTSRRVNGDAVRYTRAGRSSAEAGSSRSHDDTKCRPLGRPSVPRSENCFRRRTCEQSVSPSARARRALSVVSCCREHDLLKPAEGVVMTLSRQATSLAKTGAKPPGAGQMISGEDELPPITIGMVLPLLSSGRATRCGVPPQPSGDTGRRSTGSSGTWGTYRWPGCMWGTSSACAGRWTNAGVARPGSPRSSMRSGPSSSSAGRF